MHDKINNVPFIILFILIFIISIGTLIWYLTTINSQRSIPPASIQGQNAASSSMAQESPKGLSPETQVITPTTKKLTYCGKTFIADVVTLDNADIIDTLLQLSIASDKNNCMNFEQFSHISALQQPTDSGTLITLYENSVLTESDKKLSLDKQGQIIAENSTTIRFHIASNGSIYPISAMDGSEEPSIGTLK